MLLQMKSKKMFENGTVCLSNLFVIFEKKNKLIYTTEKQDI
jgi:hypothetical protein